MRTVEEVNAEMTALLQEERSIKEAKKEAFKEVSKDWRPKYSWSVRNPTLRHLEAEDDSPVCFMAVLSQESEDELKAFREEYGDTPMGRHESFSSVRYGWTPVPNSAEGPFQMGVVWHSGGGTLVLGPPDRKLMDVSDPTIFCTRAMWMAIRTLEITPDQFKEHIRDNKHLQ